MSPKFPVGTEKFIFSFKIANFKICKKNSIQFEQIILDQLMEFTPDIFIEVSKIFISANM